MKLQRDKERTKENKVREEIKKTFDAETKKRDRNEEIKTEMRQMTERKRSERKEARKR